MKQSLPAFLFLCLFSTATYAQTVHHWEINSITDIAGNSVQVFGNPTVETVTDGDTSYTAVHFDGVDDGIIVDANPLSGATEFTAEVIFYPEDLVGQEPRFVHFQQNDDNRVLIELRNFKEGEWYVDTFIKSGGTSNAPLIDENNIHPTNEWQHVALIMTNGKMSHYVNGVKELEGDAVYMAMTSGQVSLGMRMNQRNYLKGYIRELRVTHKALDPSEFLINQTGGASLKLVGELSDTTLAEGFATATIDLTQIFEGEGLNYSASSETEAVATVSIDGTNLVINEKGLGTSKITVTASHSNGFLTQEFTLSVDEEELSTNRQIEDLSIYPNPATEMIFISLNAETNQPVEISIRDLSGSELVHGFKQADANRALQLDVSELNAGIYMVSVKLKSEKKVFKLFKY